MCINSTSSSNMKLWIETFGILFLDTTKTYIYLNASIQFKFATTIIIILQASKKKKLTVYIT